MSVQGKTSTLEDTHGRALLPQWIIFHPFSQNMAAVLMLNTGKISKIVLRSKAFLVQDDYLTLYRVSSFYLIKTSIRQICGSLVGAHRTAFIKEPTLQLLTR